MATINRTLVLGISNGVASLRFEGTGFGTSQGENQIDYNGSPVTVTNWSNTVILGNVASSAISDIKRNFSQLEDTSGSFVGNAGKILQISLDESHIDYATLSNATITTPGLMSETDKVKINGISAGANKVEASVSNGYIKVDGNELAAYIHPATHAATIIAQDSNNRLVSDANISLWNSKAAGDHAHSGVYESANVNIQAHISAKTNPHDVTKSQVGLGNVPNVDCTNASNITTGTLPVSIMPPSVMERLVIVADQTARFALTTTTAQNGDVVKQSDTGALYFVKDDTKLSEAAGYEAFTASTASAVEWSGVLSKPTTLGGYGISDATPSSHIGAVGNVHGNATITENGFMSSTDKVKMNGISANANNVVASLSNGNIKVDGSEVVVYTHPASHSNTMITGLGTASTKDVGTIAGTVCAADDARIPTQNENDALVGTSGSPSSTNKFVTDADTRIPSQGENDALAGTSGTPSSTNKFVTDTDARMTNTRTPSAHSGSHVTGGSDVIADAVAGGNSGLMSGADKTKLNGVSTGANKVESSSINGNIKIDGVETTIYSAVKEIKRSGASTFNSTTGVTVTFTSVTDAAYQVMIQPTSNANGFLGEYWIESKTATSFVVKNSGSNTTATFDWALIK